MLTKFFLASILFVSSCLAMNQGAPSFTKVTKQNIEQLSGLVIAYQTDIVDFNSPDNYVFDNNNSIYFGLILHGCKWSTQEYMLHILLKKNSNKSLRARIDSQLSKDFSARLANEEEIEKIKNAIKNDHAKWD